jgi:hypothetical protein
MSSRSQHVKVSLNDQEAARLDEIRGDEERAVYLRRLLHEPPKGTEVATTPRRSRSSLDSHATTGSRPRSRSKRRSAAISRRASLRSFSVAPDARSLPSLGGAAEASAFHRISSRARGCARTEGKTAREWGPGRPGARQIVVLPVPSFSCNHVSKCKYSRWSGSPEEVTRRATSLRN